MSSGEQAVGILFWTGARVSPVRRPAQTAYAECARLTREYGTTYYWGALLLPRDRRRHVYAVYALCRLADDIVDAPEATTTRKDETRAALRRFQQRFEAARDGHPDDPTLAAIAASVNDATSIGVLRPLLRRHKDGPRCRPLRNLGRPVRVHGGSAAVIGG